MSELPGRVEGLMESTETAIDRFDGDGYALEQSNQIIATVLQDAKDAAGFLANAVEKMDSILTALSLESDNGGQTARELAEHASFIANILGFADTIIEGSENSNAVEAIAALENASNEADTASSTYAQAHRQIGNLAVAAATKKTIEAAAAMVKGLLLTTDTILPLISLAGTSSAEAARHSRDAKDKLEAYQHDIQ